MLKGLINSFAVPELRRRLGFTLGLIAVYRLGDWIPIPGVDVSALGRFYENLVRTPGGAIFGMMDMFAGGALANCTIFALGIMPYITSSIIFSMLPAIVPYFEKIQKEGETGRKKISQYTRYGTIVIALVQAALLSTFLENPANFGGVVLISEPGLAFRGIMTLTVTASCVFIMWLGDLITEKGIGNGMSLIITANIISRVPAALHRLWISFSPFSPDRRDPAILIVLSIILVLVVVAVILITQGQRKIPVQYAKRIVGRRVYGGASSYIPLRVNQAGVIPIIFASSILMFPPLLLGRVTIGWVREMATALYPGHPVYTVLYVLLILFFSFFYTAMIFNPVDMAENMKKYGGFVPGIRPGRPTSDYLNFIMLRITFAGAVFLALIAIFPSWLSQRMNIDYLVAQFFGGTGLLIIVGVMLDTMRQIESQLLLRHYEGFMRKGKLKSRR